MTLLPPQSLPPQSLPQRFVEGPCAAAGIGFRSTVAIEAVNELSSHVLVSFFSWPPDVETALLLSDLATPATPGPSPPPKLTGEYCEPTLSTYE